MLTYRIDRAHLGVVVFGISDGDETGGEMGGEKIPGGEWYTETDDVILSYGDEYVDRGSGFARLSRQECIEAAKFLLKAAGILADRGK